VQDYYLFIRLQAKASEKDSVFPHEKNLAEIVFFSGKSRVKGTDVSRPIHLRCDNRQLDRICILN